MRLLDERSCGASSNVSAALYVTVTGKQALKIVFLMDSSGLLDLKENNDKWAISKPAAARQWSERSLGLWIMLQGGAF
jgi:hypothetical protein